MTTEHQTLVTYLLIVAAMALFVFRNLRPQTLKISTLWLMPLVLLLLAGVSFWATTVQAPLGGLWMFAGALVVRIVLGIPFGILRGRGSRMRTGKQRGAIVVEQSAITMVLFLAAFSARYLIRFFLPSAGPGVIAASDGFMAFAITSVIASRYILYTRFRALAAP